MSAFNGQNLKLARQYNGLTIGELAKKLDISSQAESQYELGQTTPQFDNLIKLSEALHFPTTFFFQESKITVKTGSSYFRSLMKTSKKYRDGQVIKIKFLAELYTVLEEYIEFPKEDLPLNRELYKSPEDAAQILREYWNLGDEPILNMVGLLESKGFIITSFENSTKDIDAFSQYFEIQGQPVFIIAFSNNKNSAARINFDLAHELGHIMLHEWSEDNENISREDFKQHEKEANAFAAAFLLPENKFKTDLRFMPSDLGHYVELKKKWRVSIGAMLHRACELGIITQNQYQYNLRIMNAKGLRVNEPLDDVIPVSYPSMLSNAVSLLIDNKVFTKSLLIKEFSNFGLSMNSEELEKLLSLQKGYLTDDEDDDPNSFILRIK